MLKRAGLARSQQFEHAKSLILRPLIRCLPSSALARRPLLSRTSHLGQNHSASVSDVRKHPAQTTVPDHHTAPAELLLPLLSSSSTDRALIRRIRAIPSLSHLLDPTKARLLAEAIAVTPTTSHHAVQVLRLAHRLGCRLKQNAYECTAYQLARASRWRHLLAVVLAGKRQTGKTTIRLLNWRIRALVETDQHLQLQSILEEFTLYRVRPNRRSFHLLISGRIRNRDLAGAQQLLQIMQEHHIPPDESTNATIAIYYRNFGPNAQVQDRSLQMLPSLQGVTATVVLNCLIELRLDAQDVMGSLDLLTLFDSSQITSIVQCMSGVISTQGGGGRGPSSPISHPLPISPNAETFAIFIRYMASHGNLPGALGISKGLLSTNIQPTAEVVASLLHALLQSKEHVDVAVRMVAELCDPHKSPPEMFASLASNSSDVPLPFPVSGIKPTTRVFNALLKGILPIRSLDTAVDVIAIMEANGLQPNSSTMEILVSYLRNVMGVRPGTLGRFFRRLYSSSVRPSIRHLHILLSVILRHERFLTFGSGWDSVAAPFSRRRQAQVRESSYARSSGKSHQGNESIGGILLRRADNRVVKPIVEDLLSRKVNVDGAVAGLRLKQEAGIKLDLDGAQDIFQAILARGIQPNMYHFAALMEGYTRAGDMKAASELLKTATQIGIKPNVVLFTILIVGYARQGNPESAVRVFQQMVANRIQPDIGSIDAVSSAFFAVGSYGMARKSLMTLWPYIAPFPQESRELSLRQLAVEFRNLQTKSKALSKQEWIALYRKLTRLILRWRASVDVGKNQRT